MERRRFWKALGEGTAWSTAGLLVACCLLLTATGTDPDSSGLLGTDFAARWTGPCTGWTKPLATVHVLGDLLHWWSHCSIAFVFWRLHPPLHTVPRGRITLVLVGWFFMGCGVGHLLSTLTVFSPMYRLEGAWLVANGVVSAIATVAVASALSAATEHVRRKREEIERLRTELDEHRAREANR